MTSQFSFQTQCALGLESFAADEMRELGLAVGDVLQDQGLVRWTGTLDDLARAHRWLRCADRITLDLASFRARAFDEFRRKVAGIDFARFFAPGRAVVLRVVSRNSRLYHERALAERLHEGLEESLGWSVPRMGAEAMDTDEPPQLILVRLEHDRCQVRIDASGTRLHRRGYRRATAKAPLRETLAAAILRASGWTPGTPLVDPFCGSGTFAIEAAQRAAGIPPGGARRFAFMDWPMARDLTVAAETAPATPTVIAASDRVEGALRAARGNAERAGVPDSIDFRRHTVSECHPPATGPGHIVTNPPYGARTGDGDLLPLYAAFGRTLHERFGGWRLTMLCADPQCAAVMELPWTLGPRINNGGLRVRLLHAEVPADGS